MSGTAVPPLPRRRIMLIAGEPSGDVLGGRLMAALKLRTMGEVSFFGIGGEHMHAQGLDSIFPMSELSVMGLVEVLPRMPLLLRRLRETAALAQRERPDAVVTIDAPGFCFRLARRLAGQGMPLIHYVAPQVWAWRPHRAREIAGLLDHLLALLPFEPAWFEREGLPTSFVGHPVVESGADRGNGRRFRARHGIDPAAPLLAVLPGSRMGEIRRHLPIFGAAVTQLRQRFPALGIVVPTVATVAEAVAAVAATWPVPVRLIRQPEEKYDAIAACDAGLAASGTVSLELALARVPMVVAYRLNPLTAVLARRMMQVRFVNLVNLILDQAVIPELLQDDCNPAALARAVEQVMTEPAVRGRQAEAAAVVAEALGQGGEPPSLRAADAVLQAIAAGPRRRA